MLAQVRTVTNCGWLRTAEDTIGHSLDATPFPFVDVLLQTSVLRFVFRSARTRSGGEPWSIGVPLALSLSSSSDRWCPCTVARAPYPPHPFPETPDSTLDANPPPPKPPQQTPQQFAWGNLGGAPAPKPVNGLLPPRPPRPPEGVSPADAFVICWRHRARRRRGRPPSPRAPALERPRLLARGSPRRRRHRLRALRDVRAGGRARCGSPR